MDNDCGCSTHSGAHWVYQNALDKQRNRDWLASAIARNGGNMNPSIMQGFVVQERARLRELEYQMTSRGLTELPEMTESEDYATT